MLCVYVLWKYSGILLWLCGMGGGDSDLQMLINASENMPRSFNIYGFEKCLILVKIFKHSVFGNYFNKIGVIQGVDWKIKCK